MEHRETLPGKNLAHGLLEHRETLPEIILSMVLAKQERNLNSELFLIWILNGVISEIKKVTTTYHATVAALFQKHVMLTNN